MTLDSEDAVKKALNVSSLENLSEPQLLKLAALLPNISEEVQLRMVNQIPGFQKIALEAVDVVEQTFETTTASDDKAHRQLHDSLGDIRSAIKGSLAREGVSEEHERHLVDKLIETGHMEAAALSDKREFQAKEASATRFATALQASLPIVTAVIVTGARIMISRGGPRA